MIISCIDYNKNQAKIFIIVLSIQKSSEQTLSVIREKEQVLYYTRVKNEPYSLEAQI